MDLGMKEGSYGMFWKVRAVVEALLRAAESERGVSGIF